MHLQPGTQPPAPAAPLEEVQDPEVRSLWRESWRMFKRQRMALLGTFLILIFVLMGIFAPYLAPEGINDQKLEDRLQAPNARHWLGTDDFGRDILSRIMYGARISLTVGFLSVMGSIVIGTLLGLAAGYYGRWLDMLVSRVFDILLAFPSILLAIAIVAILGPGLVNAMIAIAIINIPTYGRLVRAKVFSIKEEEYITAARALGMRNGRILFHHILPNSLSPIIVQGTLGIGTAILEAASLGFLGLGAQAPQPEWGRMLADAKNYIQTAPWTTLFPGLAIMLTVLGFNLLGDGLRDALDPKMKDL